MGNIINRVFESSGPDGKVRGTPQQIIEKYLVLARDAQLSNDRVAAENFLQHAEHYTRMLGEAQREMAAEQESRRQQGGGQHQGNEGRERFGGQNRIRDEREDDQPHVAPSALIGVDDDDDGDSILVETPEARAAEPDFADPMLGQDFPPRRAERADRPERTERHGDAAAAAEPGEGSGRGPRRGPRRGRGGSGSGGGSEEPAGSAAAE
jgi:hypothetical protein